VNLSTTEKMWNVLGKNIYHGGKEDDDGWISFTNNELNHMNNYMRYFEVFLVRIIKLFTCVLWFITKVFSKFTWEQMPSQKTISYIVEKHVQVITLFGWMKPRIQVKYDILKFTFWPQLRIFMLIQWLIIDVKLSMGITLEGLKCL
jgi:hypothetical protein